MQGMTRFAKERFEIDSVQFPQEAFWLIEKLGSLPQ